MEETTKNEKRKSNLKHNQKNKNNYFIIGYKNLFFVNNNRKINCIFYYPTFLKKKNINKNHSLEINKYYKIMLVKDAPLYKNNTNLLISTSGTGGSLITNIWLYKDVIKNNYSILSVNREGNSFTSKDPIKYIEQWQYPIDISECLTKFLNKKFDNIKMSNYIKNISFIGFSVGGLTGLYLAGAQTKHKIKKVNSNTFMTTDFLEENIDNTIFDKVNYKPFYKNYKDIRINKFILMAPVRGLINTRIAEHSIDVFTDSFSLSNKKNKKIKENDKGFLFFENGLKDIKGENVLILTGDKDEIVNKELNSFYLHKNIKNSKLIKYKNCNHFCFLFQNTYMKNKSNYLEYIIGNKHSTNINRKKIQKTIIKDIITFLEK